MLQRIIAVVLLVAGVVGVVLGVASATVWRDSDTVVATTSYAGDGTMLVTEPGVLDLVDDDVTIRATVPGEQAVTLAIGRDVDVEGWVGQDPHGVVTGLADWETLATQEGAAPEPTDASADEATDPPADDATDDATDAPADEATDDAPVTGVDPAGSDMWLAEATGAGSATLRWSDQQGRWRLLVAGVGEGAVAPTLELSWPREVTTPWLWPAVIGGGVLILIGLGVGAAALRSGRRTTSGRRGTTAPTPAVTASGAAPAAGPDDASSSTTGTSPDEDARPLTRRELREREESERLAQQQARAQRPRRAWLTGQIPVVSKERRPKTAAQPVVDAGTSDPEPLDVTTTRADAWRRTWGFSATTSSDTTGAGTAPEHATNDETKDGTS